MGLAILGTAYEEYFHVQFADFSSRSFGALYKICDVKIFKRLLLPVFIQFQPNFTESMYSGEIQAITFSDDLPNFKSIWQFEIYVSTKLPLSIKLCWFQRSSMMRSTPNLMFDTYQMLQVLYNLNEICFRVI